MSFESPISVLQNLAGEQVAVVSGSALNNGEQPGIAILAKDESGNAQFLNLNASGELKVQATVDVALSASTDSILVYGSADVALQQDGERANSLKTYDAYVSGAIDNMGSNLGGKLDTIDSSVGAVETAVDNASSAISGSVVALGADLGGKLDTLNAVDFATETTLAAFKSDNRSDLQAVSGAIDLFRADFNAEDFASETTLAAFKADNRSDLQAVSGAIDLFRADFIAEDFASETTLAAFKSDNRSDLQAVSGAIDAMKIELEATLTSIDGKDFATEATLNAFKTENNSNLVALSSSLDRFSFSGGALSVTGNLDVNVGLTASGSVEAGYGAYDTVNIFGDEGIPFSQISGSGEMITVPLGSEGNSLLQAASGSIHSDVSGNGALLIGLLGSNSKNVLQSSVNDILLVSGAGNFNVVATDLDIRDLNYLDDSVKIYGSEDAVLQQEAGTFKLLVKDADAISAIDAVEIAVGDANAAIVNALTGSSSVSGSIAALGADLGAKLDLFTFESDRLMISGSVLVSNPFDGVVTATDFDIRDLSSATDSISAVQSGDWIVRKHATSAAVSTANASVTSAEVLASNVDRMNATFFMDGNATCYIKLGGAASNSDFSIRLVNNGYYELPEGYTGAIHAVFSVTDAAIKLRMTELSYV